MYFCRSVQGRCASGVYGAKISVETALWAWLNAQFLIFPTNKLDKAIFAINFDAFSTWKNRSLNLVSWFQRLLTLSMAARKIFEKKKEPEGSKNFSSFMKFTPFNAISIRQEETLIFSGLFFPASAKVYFFSQEMIWITKELHNGTSDRLHFSILFNLNRNTGPTKCAGIVVIQRFNCARPVGSTGISRLMAVPPPLPLATGSDLPSTSLTSAPPAQWP